MGIEKDLRKFFYNEELSDDEVSQISALAEYREYQPGEVILAQDTVNDRLFFLVEGAVAVIRSGEKIATLSNPGDLLGEISLITQKVCTATNVADKKTSLLVFEKEKVSKLPKNIQTVFSSALNRLFSVILAEKLTVTNEKARLFEITNRELQVAKKALESASAVRINDLSSSQRVLFSKLNSIKHQLDEISSSEGYSRVKSVLSVLEPITSNFAAENNLSYQKVLLVENDVNEQINARMSLGGTGIDFKVTSNIEEAKAALQNDHFNILCVNENFLELIEFVRILKKETQFVFITSQAVQEHFQTLKKYPELSTILVRHPKDRTFTVKNMATTIRKLSSSDIFGMEKYLNWGTEVLEHTVSSSEQRVELISKLEEYIDAVGIRGGLKRKASRVAEELLMNAIYDAPVDESGKSLYNHMDRAVPLVLKPEEYSKFRYACDGGFLAISVADPFGALNRQKILKYLDRCINQPISADGATESGGGGNGLYQIIQSSSLTAFNVQPGVQTEAIALLNINVQTEKVSTHPSFHYFESTKK